jgi:hypothetical protein
MANPNFDAPERRGDFMIAPVAFTTTIYAGNLTALDNTGSAVECDDIAGIRCIGRLELDIVNGLTYQNDAEATIKRGVFKYQNSAINPIAQVNVGQICFVETSQIVATTSVHKVKAGIVVEVDSDGVYVDTRKSDSVPQADTLTPLLATVSNPLTGPEATALINAIHALLQGAGIML